MEDEGRGRGSSDFGTLLRRYRLAAGLSQETLAERARVSLNGISFYIVPSRHRIIAPDPCNDDADIYAYPAGGSPILTITGGLEHPIGAVLSK